ncbi:MAG: class II fructose-bisphosphate aldolase [Sebaldella sp.]|nr:class II fructose-bisphosphate aldolase [Sebaldella sp.]
MLVSMKEMLNDANEKNYAVLAINCFNLETARAVVEAAKEKEAPIILNIVQEHFEEHAKAELMGSLVKTLCENSNIPIALNLDHGKNYESCIYALRYGFTSLMIDASINSLKENIDITKEVVRLASPIGVSVEGELGHIGSSGNYEKEKQENLYTNIDEVEEFFRKTGVDALAISCGTAHGLYESGVEPIINFELIKKIKNKVQKPLVLHGGSGAGEGNIRRAVLCGINKINVGADIFKAGRVKIYSELKENSKADLFDLMKKMEAACKNEILRYIELSGSKGQGNNFKNV